MTVTAAALRRTSSSTSRPGSPAPTAPSSSPTAAPRSSRWSRPRAIRCGAGRRPGPRSPPVTTARCSRSSSSSKQSVVADPDDEDDLARVHALLERADAVVWSKGSRLAELPDAGAGRRSARRAAPDRHLDHAVRPGRAVVRPRRDRVHPAGLVGRDRRSGSRLAGPGAGVRRRADRRVAHRRRTPRSERWCRSDAGAARRPGRARRRVDARDARACASPTTR